MVSWVPAEVRELLPTDTRRSGWADSWLRVGGHEISGTRLNSMRGGVPPAGLALVVDHSQPRSGGTP